MTLVLPAESGLNLEAHLGRFGYSFEAQVEEALAWEARHGITLTRISDWNVPGHCVAVPSDLVERAFRETLPTLTHYAETAQLVACGEEIRQAMSESHGPLPEGRDVHLFGNATQAITAVVYALKELMGAPLTLLTHPSYYAFQDALRLCGLEAWGCFREAARGFAFDPDLLAQLVRRHRINVLVITDPVYSSGLSLDDQSWRELIALCAREGLWLVVDAAFGGLHWSDPARAWLDGRLLAEPYEKLIVIDAPAKRLFVNGAKLGLVLAPEEVVGHLQDFTDWHLGNLAALQLRLAQLLFSPAQRPYIEVICRENAAKAASAYEVLAGHLKSSEHAYAFRPDSGFYAMLYARNSSLRDVDVMAGCRAWMEQRGVLVIPNADFHPSAKDDFGVRINLLRPLAAWSRVVADVADRGMPL